MRPFEFQRFTIQQTRSAMKVGFDGVLLGSWARLGGGPILDLGTGTGLIALMAAQRTETATPPIVDGVEIDSAAVLDARANYLASPWHDRLRLHHARFQDWTPVSDAGYSSILCNPPFFHESRTVRSSRSIARHDGELGLRDLLGSSSRLLANDGRLSVIVPASRLEELQSLSADFALHLRRISLVRPLPERPHHRVLVELSAVSGFCECDELTIETVHHQYSPEFRRLTRNFYIQDYQP